MADTSKLKPTAVWGKPPASEIASTNLQEPTREALTEVRKVKIEFSIPEGIAEQFAHEAG